MLELLEDELRYEVLNDRSMYKYFKFSWGVLNAERKRSKLNSDSEYNEHLFSARSLV